MVYYELRIYSEQLVKKILIKMSSFCSDGASCDITESMHSVLFKLSCYAPAYPPEVGQRLMVPQDLPELLFVKLRDTHAVLIRRHALGDYVHRNLAEEHIGAYPGRCGNTGLEKNFPDHLHRKIVSGHLVGLQVMRDVHENLVDRIDMHILGCDVPQIDADDPGAVLHVIAHPGNRRDIVKFKRRILFDIRIVGRLSGKFPAAVSPLPCAVDLPYSLDNLKKPRPSGDTVGFERGRDRKTDSLFRAGYIRNDKICLKGIEASFDTLDGCIEGLEVYSDESPSVFTGVGIDRSFFSGLYAVCDVSFRHIKNFNIKGPGQIPEPFLKIASLSDLEGVILTFIHLKDALNAVLDHLPYGNVRVECHVRCEQDVRIGLKDCHIVVVQYVPLPVEVIKSRFMLYRIEPRETDPAGFYRVYHRSGIYQHAPCTVDDHHAVLHHIQLGFSDHMVIGLKSRNVERDDVTAFVNGLEIGICCVLCGRFVFLYVIAEHPASEAREMLDDLGSDPAGSDDTHGAVLDMSSEFSFQGIILDIAPVNDGHDPAKSHQHHHDRVIGNSRGIVGDRCGADADLVSIGVVNVIVSDSTGRYVSDSEALKLIEECGIHHIGQDAQGIVPFRKMCIFK